MQVPLEAAPLVVLRGDQPFARGGQFVELLGELRGQAHVRDGCRGLARDRAQQRPLGVAVLAAPAGPTSMRPSVWSACTRSTDSTGSPTTSPATPTANSASAPSVPRPDAHPRRIEPVADRGGEMREQVARFAGLLEPRAELAEHLELLVAVAEHEAVDASLQPRAERQEGDRDERREQHRADDGERSGEQHRPRRRPRRRRAR